MVYFLFNILQKYYDCQPHTIQLELFVFSLMQHLTESQRMWILPVLNFSNHRSFDTIWQDWIQILSTASHNDRLLLYLDIIYNIYNLDIYIYRILPGTSISLIYCALTTKTNRIARILAVKKMITYKPRLVFSMKYIYRYLNISL